MTGHAVNLLPWRVRQEEKRRRTYFSMLALSVILPSLAAALLHWEKGKAVDEVRSELSDLKFAQERIEGIKDEQALLASRTAEAEAWLAEYEVFYARRLLFLRLWSELARHLPDSMHYRKLQLERRGLMLAGVTSSSPDLATFMRRLEASPAIASPRLTDLEDTPLGHRFGIEAKPRAPR